MVNVKRYKLYELTRVRLLSQTIFELKHQNLSVWSEANDTKLVRMYPYGWMTETVLVIEFLVIVIYLKFGPESFRDVICDF